MSEISSTNDVFHDLESTYTSNNSSINDRPESISNSKVTSTLSANNSTDITQHDRVNINEFNETNNDIESRDSSADLSASGSASANVISVAN